MKKFNQSEIDTNYKVPPNDSEDEEVTITPDGKYWVHWPVFQDLQRKLEIQNRIEWARRQRVAGYQAENTRLMKDGEVARQMIRDLKLKLQQQGEAVARLEFLLKEKENELQQTKPMDDDLTNKVEALDIAENVMKEKRRRRRMFFDLT